MSVTRDQARRTTLEHLSRQLSRLERSHGPPVGDGDVLPVSTGVAAFDRLLPGGGLSGGMLVECLAEGAGSGAGMLAFVLARRFVGEPCLPATQRGAREGNSKVGDQQSAVSGQRSVNRGRSSGPSTQYAVLSTQCSTRTTDNRQRTTPTTPHSPLTTHPTRALVVIDPQHEFYPPAAAGLGLDLDETIIVRPGNSHDALWALEQSLRCPGVAVTLAWLDRLEGRASRRLALAVETGGGLGFLLRPAVRQRDSSSAHVRLLVQPRATDHGQQTTQHSPLTTHHLPDALPRGSRLNEGSSRRLNIHLLRGRKGHVAESIELELCDEPPGPVHLAAPLADPAAAGRATGT